MVLEDVPEETRLWKPETAPQATVTNKIGNKFFVVETSVNWKHVKTKRCCQLLPTLKGSGLAKGSVTR